MNWLVAVVALLLPAVAGCMGPVQDSPPPDDPLQEIPEFDYDPDAEPTCVLYVCEAHPDSHDAALARKLTGLEKLTDDDTLPHTLSLDGEWVAWATQNEEKTFSCEEPVRFMDHYTCPIDIFAMHLPTHEIHVVSADRGKAILPYLSDGRVVYEYTSEDWHGLVLWEAGSNETTQLDPALGISYRPYGFEGDWVVFYVGDGTADSQGSLWAWNIQTDEKILLYEETNDSRRFGAEGTHLYIDADILDAKAYYIVAHGHGHEGEEGARPPDSTIYEVDLETGEEREWFNDWPGAHNTISAASDRVVFQALPDVVVLNTETGEYTEPAPEYEKCKQPDASGIRAIMKCDHDMVIVNLETGELSTLPEHPKIYFGNDPVIDGQTIITVATPNDSKWFSSTHSDLYMIPYGEQE